MTFALRKLLIFLSLNAYTGYAQAQSAEQLQLLQANPSLVQQIDMLGNNMATEIDPASGIPSAEVASSPNAADARNDIKIVTQSQASTASPESIIQSYYNILSGKSLPIYGASEFQQQQDPSLLFFNTMGKNYRLAAGDILRVTLRGLMESDTTYKIGRDGNLILPNLAPINVSGFTIADAERRLLETLKLDDAAASVFISLETARLITVQVSGAVSRPRTLAVPAYTPLSRVLAYAGGIKATGSLRNIVLRDRDGNVETVDFYDFLQSPEGANDPLVTDSSRVFVGNQGLTIATDGFVARPGIYELPTGVDQVSIRSLLKLSGTRLIPPGAQIEVLYFDEDGLSKSRDVAINETVSAGEVLRIRFVNTRNLEAVSVRGAVLNEYEFATSTSVALRDVLKGGSALRSDVKLEFALVLGQHGASRALNLRRALLDDTVRIAAGELLYVFPKAQYSALVQANPNATNDPIVAELSNVDVGEIYLNGRRLAFLAPAKGQTMQDILSPHYRLTPQTVTEFAVLQTPKSGVKNTQAISLSEALEKRTPINITGNTKLFLFERAFYNQLLKNTAGDISTAENATNDFIARSASVIDEANILQIFLDDIPFAFLPGETPQTLEEIVDILGALPTDLATELVYYETQERTSSSGVTSFAQKISPEFDGDMSIYFFSDVGLKTLIAQESAPQSSMLMQTRIADATSIYVNDRLVALLDGTNTFEVMQKIEELSSLYADIYPLFSTISKFNAQSALYQTQIVKLKDLFSSNSALTNGARLDLLTASFVRSIVKPQDKEKVIEQLTEGSDEQMFMEGSGEQEKIDRLPITIREQLLKNSSRYIGGAIALPGEYPVAEDVSLAELIETAGGFAQNADVTSISVQFFGTSDNALVLREEKTYDATKSDISMVTLRDRYLIEVNPLANDAVAGSIIIDGEVKRPGTYTFAPSETLHDIIAKTGGLRPVAYPLGAVFTRESMKVTQKESNDILANQLEQAVLQISNSDVEGTGEQINAVLGYAAQLRRQEVSGRLAVNILIEDISAPIYLEPGDVLTIPKRPAHVSVIGSVQKDTVASYSADKRLSAYLAAAGGTSKIADLKRIYILLPNGESSLADEESIIPPGAVIVVPPKTDRLTVLGVTDLVSRVMGNIATSVLAINNVR